MTPLERSLRDAVGALGRAGARSALVGGLAVAVRAEPRLTRDADLAVAVGSDEEAEAVVRSMVADGYRLVATVEHERAQRLAAVRLARTDSDLSTVTDLLFASSGIEPEIVNVAEEIEIVRDLRVPVASVGHLIATKLLAHDDRLRPADADDLASLATVATTDDWEQATVAVQLIEQRGFHRDRNLTAALERLRSEAAY